MILLTIIFSLIIIGFVVVTKSEELTVFLWGTAIAVATVIPYFTHVVWTIKLLMKPESPAFNQIVLAVIGAFIPPFGIIHGWILWFA